MPEKSIRARCCRGQAAADAGANPVFERHWNGGLLALKTLLGIYQTKCPDLSNQVSAYSQDTQIPNARAVRPCQSDNRHHHLSCPDKTTPPAPLSRRLTSRLWPYWLSILPTRPQPRPSCGMATGIQSEGADINTLYAAKGTSRYATPDNGTAYNGNYVIPNGQSGSAGLQMYVSSLSSLQYTVARAGTNTATISTWPSRPGCCTSRRP